MPSLGFLKKKRTKEQPTAPDRFPGNKSAGPSSPTSPTVDGGAIDRVLTKNSALNKGPDSIGGDPDTVAPTSTAAPAHAPTVQSMLNNNNTSSSQNDSGYSSHDGSVQQGGATSDPKATQNATRETKGKYTLTDFNIQRTLGTGSFGRVHLVQSKHNQRFYAVKVLKKAQVVKMKQVEHTNDERRMLQRCKHPFLVTLWGTWQDSKNLYMVMDFIEGGELFSLLRKSQVRLLPFAFFTIAKLILNFPALPQPRRQILRRRSDPGAGLPAQHEHHLSRSQARELAPRPTWPHQDHRFRLCQRRPRHHLDAMRHAGLPRPGSC